MKKLSSTLKGFMYGVILTIALVFGIPALATSFSSIDVGDQEDGDIDAKVRQLIDNDYSTITLYHARDDGGIYKARVVGVNTAP